MLKKIQKHKTCLLLLAIIVISNLWLITEGMPKSHDIGFHYGRIVGLSNSIKDGDFLALIHNFFYGCGYANGLFYSNFFIYIPAILANIGFTYIGSLKILYLLINIFTTLSIYYSLKSITKNNNLALIGTILYVFSNYRLVDTYARGALGEMLAFMVIPIIILGLYEIVFRDYKKWYIFSIGCVLLLLSHIISTLVMGFFIIIFIIMNYRQFLNEKIRIKYLMVSTMISILLGAFFIFPILEQKLYGNINVFEGVNYFITWKSAVSLIDFLVPMDFFNTSLGFVMIGLIPIRFFVHKKDFRDKSIIKFADSMYILGIVAWISTTKLFPWKSLGKCVFFLQFPWRLLIISTSFLVFSFAVYFMKLKKKKKFRVILHILIGLSVVEIIGYTVNFGFLEKQYWFFFEEEIGAGEYLIHNTETEDLLGKLKVITSNDNIKITYKKKGLTYNITYKNNQYDASYIELPMFNYYGYEAVGDAELVNGNNNFIRLNLNKTNGKIYVSYKKTITQITSYMISAITALSMFLYLLLKKISKGNLPLIS